MNNAIFDRLTKFLNPISQKIAGEPHIAAIAAGVVATLPFTMAGAVVSIIKSLTFLPESFRNLLNVPYNMTMGVIAVVVAFSVAYQFSQRADVDTFTSPLTSVIMFLMVAAPQSSAIFTTDFVAGKALKGQTISDVISFTYLGARGMFLAIIIALVSVEITVFCKKRHLVIKMPESVPPYVSKSFSAVIPVVLNMIIFYALSLLASSTLGLTIPQVIDKVLTPALNIVGSIWGIILLTIFAQLLWLLGLHGDNLMYAATVYPMSIQAILLNGQLAAAGKPLQYTPALTFIFHSYGGAGATIGLAFWLLFARSKQLKTMGKIGIVPAIFNINEPLTYGIPIMLNPTLAIPFIICPILSVLIAHFAWITGFMPLPSHMSGGLPLIINEFVYGGGAWQYVVVGLIIVVMSLIIYYPFFKIYDNQLLAKEKASETADDAKGQGDSL